MDDLGATEAAPAPFICQISYEIMRDPVTTADGHSCKPATPHPPKPTKRYFPPWLGAVGAENTEPLPLYSLGPSPRAPRCGDGVGGYHFMTAHWDGCLPPPSTCHIRRRSRSPTHTPLFVSDDRWAITTWLETHDTSPATGARLGSKELTENVSLRQAIEECLLRCRCCAGSRAIRAGPMWLGSCGAPGWW